MNARDDLSGRIAVKVWNFRCSKCFISPSTANLIYMLILLNSNPKTNPTAWHPLSRNDNAKSSIKTAGLQQHGNMGEREKKKRKLYETADGNSNWTSFSTHPASCWFYPPAGDCIVLSDNRISGLAKWLEKSINGQHWYAIIKTIYQSRTHPAAGRTWAGSSWRCRRRWVAHSWLIVLARPVVVVAVQEAKAKSQRAESPKLFAIHLHRRAIPAHFGAQIPGNEQKQAVKAETEA